MKLKHPNLQLPGPSVVGEERNLSLWTEKCQDIEEHHGKGCWAASGHRLGSRGLRLGTHPLVPDPVATTVIPKLCSAESWSQKALKKKTGSMIQQFGKLYLVHFPLKESQ